MLPKTVIIGATGFIGKFFFAEHRKIHPDCIGTSQGPGREGISFLDLSSPRVVSLKLAESGHQEALIFAGIAKIAECEREKERTREINVDGTVSLIQQLVNEGIKPIFFSSDNIFDGRTGLYDDESPPGPLNEYARQKAEVEFRIKEICSDGNYLIVRLPKTFSLDKGDGTLFDEMASTLKSGGSLRAAYDQIFSPLFVLDVINIITILQMKNVTGAINVSSPEVWSRYDLAVALAECMGVSSRYVEKISLDDLQETFERPKNTSMKTGKIIRGTGYAFTPVIQCIARISENWREEVNMEDRGTKIGKLL